MEIEYDILYKLYIIEHKSVPAISKILNKSSTAIYSLLKKFDIKCRDKVNCQNKKQISKDYLIDLYVNKKYTIYEISKEIKVGDETIRRMLHKYKIKVRSRTQHLSEYNTGRLMLDEQKQKLSEIKKEYYKNNKHWNCGNKTEKETRIKISMTLLNGREPAPRFYGKDWRIQRTSCLHRDEYTCQQCGKTESLNVHHWTPYRFCFDNSLDNLITLCVECHRDIHKEYINEGFIEEMEECYYEKI